MHRLLVILAIGASAFATLVTAASTQPPAASRQLLTTVPGVRLYVLDGGRLQVPDPMAFGVTKEEVGGTTDMPVPAYLIVHPKGTLLWDTGLGDRLVGRPASETRVGNFGQTVTRSLVSQLSGVGVRPDEVTYLALSHLHFDHVGNANDYARATWVVQKAERDSVWGSTPLPSFANPASVAAFSALKDSKSRVIEGDHDVFGDGTVVIKSTPGHTPGHQSLFVRLARTGPLVLSGDLYHYRAERTLKKMPAREARDGQTAASRESLETFIKTTGAQLWIQHDLVHHRTLKKAPEFYD